MAFSAHFINKQAGIGREGLSPLGEKRYRSCCWAISETEAQALLGGWIYLHETKISPSAIGGFIDGVEPAGRDGTARENGFAITFRVRPEGRGLKWRGASHGMAWWSGLVEASASHEVPQDS